MRKELLAKVTGGGRLTASEAESVGTDLAQGRAEPLQTAAFLGALAARGETAEELSGLASAFRREATPFQPFPEAVDTCGTGGDGRHSFNLSTAAALVVASLGVPVAKHGNRSISSRCGSADLLEHLGYPISEPPEEARARMERCGFVFLFAPLYHPAMARVALVRKALGVRTAFNFLGPTLNPALAGRQVVGVFRPEAMELMARTLLALGTRRSLVIHGEGGYDEAVLHGRVAVREIRDGRMESYELGASDFGLPPCTESELAGGDAGGNAALLCALLEGSGPAGLRDAVAANAALALRAAGRCEDLREGAGLAREALGGGRTARFLNRVLSSDGEVRRAQVS